MIDFNRIKKVHFIGVGGIGISAVARLMLAYGKTVTGSDLVETDITKKLQELGATLCIGEHKASTVAEDVDLIVYTDAVPENNPERQKMETIEGMSYFEFLGALSQTKNTIAISGAHGKTTTTAITGLLFEAAEKDPTVIVGTKVRHFNGNLRVGNSELLIVEADEYHAHMLELFPNTIILNNIEADHLDYYKSLDNIVKTFQKYLDKLPKEGVLIYNADDPIIEKRIILPEVATLSYSLHDKKADLFADTIVSSPGKQEFDLSYLGEHIGHFTIHIPGEFNISNSLGAVLTGLHYGIKPEVINRALSHYMGSWRRFEKVGVTLKGSLIISDYAHHPTEVLKSLEAARSFYPTKKLIVAFQPHQIDRTKQLFSEFVDVLSIVPVDQIIIQEIYEVAGREEDEKAVSSQDLVREINKRLEDDANKAIFTGSFNELKDVIRNSETDESVVIIMGAGDIDNVARDLAK